MTADVARVQEAREELFQQGEVHFYSPAAHVMPLLVHGRHTGNINSGSLGMVSWVVVVITLARHGRKGTDSIRKPIENQRSSELRPKRLP